MARYGLVHAFSFVHGTRVDLAQNLPLQSQMGSAFSLRANREAKGFALHASLGGTGTGTEPPFSQISHPRARPTTGDFSCLLLGDYVAEATIAPVFSNGGGTYQWRLQANFNGSAVAAGAFSFLTYDGTFTNVGANSLIAAGMQMFAGVRTGANLGLFVNGKSAATASGTIRNVSGTKTAAGPGVGWTSAADGNFAIGTRYTGKGFTALAYFADRAWCDADLDALAGRDRWGLFWSPRRTWFFSNAATGALLDGNAACTAFGQGELITTITVGGLAAGTAVAAGELLSEITFADLASGTGLTQGELDTEITFVDTATAVANAGGALTTAITFEDAATGTATASGELETAGEGALLDGNALASAAASGELATGVQLDSLAACVAVAQGELTTAITFVDQAGASAAVNGVLETAITLDGTVLLDAVTGGALTTEITFSGAAVAVVNIFGELSGGTGPAYARNTDLAQVTPAHQLTRTTARRTLARI